MAVRYEAACQEARLHYIRICDGPEEDEWRARIDRLAVLTAEIKRISEIEQSSRALLPDDPDEIQVLALCPRPVHPPATEPLLADLAAEHLADLLPLLQRAIMCQKRGDPFRSDALPLLWKADSKIPGVGMHHSIMDGSRYRYPFNAEFEGVLRPLRYILNQLGQAYNQSSSTRPSVQTAGGHLEGCVKAACGKRHQRRPLGSALKHSGVMKQLGNAPVEAMKAFTDLAVNPAKHDYNNARGPEPLFTFDDAVYAYYLARRFGADTLQASNKIAPLLEAVEQATARDLYFRGAALPVP